MSFFFPVCEEKLRDNIPLLLVDLHTSYHSKLHEYLYQLSVLFFFSLALVSFQWEKVGAGEGMISHGCKTTQALLFDSIKALEV